MNSLAMTSGTDSLADNFDGTKSNHLVVLHFNDVYNVEARPAPEPVGGATRFSTAVKSFQQLNPLILFSGDAFSPSMCKFFLNIYCCNFIYLEKLIAFLKTIIKLFSTFTWIIKHLKYTF